MVPAPAIVLKSGAIFSLARNDVRNEEPFLVAENNIGRDDIEAQLVFYLPEGYKVIVNVRDIEALIDMPEAHSN